MGIFEISRSGQQQDIRDHRLQDIKLWLEENVGRYYCRGDKRLADNGEEVALYIGAGWEIRAYYEDYDDRDIGGWCGYRTGYVVDITDEEQSMMFALRWA